MKGYGYHYSKCPGGGSDNGRLLEGLAAVALAVIIALAAIELIWYIVAVLAVILITGTAGLIIGGRMIRRKYHGHAAMLEATRAERLAAVRGPRRAEVAPVINFNFYAAPEEQAQAVRKVIPGRLDDTWPRPPGA